MKRQKPSHQGAAFFYFNFFCVTSEELVLLASQATGQAGGVISGEKWIGLTPGF